MDRIIFKGVTCRLATYRVMGEDRPALYYIDAPDQQTMLEAGFSEVHYGLWARILADEELEEVLDMYAIKEMFREFEFNEKPERLISEVNGLALPEDYLSFMSEHNGGEGPLGENNYGRFYNLEELKEINDEYDVQNSWPGYIVIGGIDDALWAYSPDRRTYCQIDSCNTGEDTYYTISDSLEGFLIKMDEELAD